MYTGMECVQHPEIRINYRSRGINNNINVVSFRFCSSLKVDRLTGGCLQGSFTECLGQRWL